MLTTGFNLEQRIVDLARADIDGRLADLLQQYSVDCRGLPSDTGQLHTANELIHCDVVAKALAVMFDLPEKECIDAEKRVLLRHPRREVALALIDEYARRHGQETPRQAGGFVYGQLTGTKGGAI